MPITPFRVRITQPGNSPPWLRTGTGERMLQTFGLMIDCRMERLTQGMLAHMPRSDIARSQAPYDALLVMASDRVITPGATESAASLAVREQRAFDDWQLAGLPWGVLSSTLGALLSSQPTGRTIATTFDPSTYPPTRVSSQWETFVSGDPWTAAPQPAYGLAGGNGDLDWDSLSPITGSWGSWSAYVVLYSVAPNDWAGTPQSWGQGSVYTPAAGGYYSTVSGGAYVASGSYAGTTRAWGEGSTYTPSADGYYSTIATGAYTMSGYYNGQSVAWGVALLGSVGTSLQVTIAQRKPANVWIRSIVVSRDATLFDPTKGADGTHNPAGTFGQWSIVSGGAYVESRFSTAVYGGEVI